MRHDMCSLESPKVYNLVFENVKYEIEEIGDTATIFNKSEIMITCDVGSKSYYKNIINAYNLGFKKGSKLDEHN